MSGEDEVVPASVGPRRSGDGETGLSLVELIVSMALLAIMLTAAASSLIAMVRTTVVNEHRVQATAFLNQVQEELQAAPWAQATLYEDEIDPLADVGAFTAATPPTFEGQELVLLEGPDNSGCDVDEPDCGRLPFVPVPYETITVDDQDYEIYRLVTWQDRSGDGEHDVKRFTTIVRWETLGRTVEQRFDSERAPTPAEVESLQPPEVTQFDVTSPVALDDDLTNVHDITVVARFSKGITSAKIRYPVLVQVGWDCDEDEFGNEVPPCEPVYAEIDEEQSLTGVLFEGSDPKVFSGQIDAGEHLFPDGAQTFELIGLHGIHEITATTSVEFLDEGAFTQDRPEVTGVTLNRLTVKVPIGGPQAGKLLCTLEVTATVSGLEADGTVTATYAAGAAAGATMTHAGGSSYTLTFESGSTSLWTPPTKEIFAVSASNPGGPSSSHLLSDVVSFEGAESSAPCP